MKTRILILTFLLIPFVSSAQVYSSTYEANKAAYEASAVKQCGKPSCVPDTEPDTVVVATTTTNVEEVKDTSEVTEEQTREEVAVTEENTDLKERIALLEKLILLLQTLLGLKQ